MDLRIDEDTWEAAGALRRQEWRTLIADLLAESSFFEEPRPAKVIVRVTAVAFCVEAHAPASESPRTFEVPRADLTSQVDEYLAVIRSMHDDSATMQRLEALDMAKKVVHDSAARTMMALVPELSRAHEVHRRLFSLFVALAVDTTKLSLAHRHR